MHLSRSLLPFFFFIVAVVGALLTLPVGKAAADDAAAAVTKKKVDALFAAWDKPGSPGCALAVYRDRKIVYKRGYGTANLEYDAPITPSTVFYIGSLSKQFTAFAVALLAKQGKIGLDDDIRRYLPEMPDYGTPPVTVRHLLHHTGGVRDYGTLLGLAGRRGDEAFDNRDILTIMARQKALNFKPGDEYLYSNSGYALLATIVERASGDRFGAFLEKCLFQPLGMTRTLVGDDLGRIVRNRAHGYAPGAGGGGFRTDIGYNQRTGPGGVWTTVEDLLHWDENFHTGRVGGKDLIRQMETPGTLNDGTKLRYGFGLMVQHYRGLPVVEHSGALAGYRAHLIRFPGQRFSVAILTNLGTMTPGTLARRVADLYLEGKFPAHQPRPAAQTPPPGPAAAASGDPPPSPAPPPLTAERAAEYIGAFRSDEIAATYTILRASAEGGGLRLRDPQGRESDMRPSSGAGAATAADGFTVPFGAVRFVRDAGGRVTGFLLDAGRVKNLRFERMGDAPAPANQARQTGC